MHTLSSGSKPRAASSFRRARSPGDRSSSTRSGIGYVESESSKIPLTTTGLGSPAIDGPRPFRFVQVAMIAL